MFMRRRTERTVGAVAAVLGGTFAIAAVAFATNGFAAGALQLTAGAVVAGIAGFALLIAAAGLFAHRRWGWGVDIAAHVIGIGAAVLALLSVMSRSDDFGESGSIVSAGLLLLLVASLFALWRARPRHPIRKAGHRMAAKLY